MPLPPGYSATATLIAEQAMPLCPICGSNDANEIARGYDYELESCANEWRIRRCQTCGAARLDPRPDIAALPVIYPSNYYSYAMSETLSPLVLKGKAWLDRLKFSSILRRLGHKPLSYLDVGCGDGHYLEFMAREGLSKDRLYGIELGASATLKAKGFQVFDQRVEDCTEITPASLDLITMFHVVEHLPDPVLTLTRLREWLAPGGLLALETPNLDSWDARLFRRRWWGGYHFPRHWVLFNPSSIRAALEKSGLELIAIRYQTGHSFWLYSFHHMLRYNCRWPMPHLARLFDPLRSKLVLILATGFDILRRLLGFKTSAMLILARRNA